MARLIAQKLSDGLNVPVVVENRPGAGGMVGANCVAKSRPDGYTLLQVTGAYPAAAALAVNAPFDVVKDMSMVSLVTSYPFIINVPSNSAFQNFAEFLAFAKANPGKLNYSSSGIGSIGHLSAKLMNNLGGIETVHIPTKGGNTQSEFEAEQEGQSGHGVSCKLLCILRYRRRLPAAALFCVHQRLPA
jgi:tripartite-type tricarboxylate transporter receptor subunit TctC